MGENVLIVSDNSWVKKNKKRAIVSIVFAIISVVIFFVCELVSGAIYDGLKDIKAPKTDPAWKLVDKIDTASVFFLLLAAVLAALAVVLLAIFFYVRKTELTVTDKRIYGKVAFGKQVDLPVDSISAVSTSALKGIAVATSSGKISFLGLTNRDEISKEISNLLIERQNTKTAEVQSSATAPASNSMDDLIKLNDLLKAGIITQEEFDLKKKQLLGL